MYKRQQYDLQNPRSYKKKQALERLWTFSARRCEKSRNFAAGFPKESGCIGLYRSKITNNGPKMLNRNEIEIPHERGRTMSLTEVLIEMGLLSSTEVTDV